MVLTIQMKFALMEAFEEQKLILILEKEEKEGTYSFRSVLLVFYWLDG